MWNTGASVRGGRHSRVHALVPHDYAGTITGLGCPDHSTWTDGDTLRTVLGAKQKWEPLWERVRTAGLSGIRWGDEEFPLALLREPIAAALRTGETQNFLWTPWRSVD